MSVDALPPVIVAGFGRCGSSLVMQMLHATDFPVTGEYPSFECEEYQTGELAPPAGASKILNLDCETPPGGPYRWIWLDRNPAQQAKSQAKLLRELGGIRMSRKSVRAMACNYAPSRRASFDVMHRLGGPVLVLSFEQIVQDPATAAKQIAEFVGCSGAGKMAAVVRRRGPECLPYLLEAELVASIRGRVDRP